MSKNKVFSTGNQTETMARRSFVKTCLATATAVAANPGLLAQAAPVKSYHRALLVDPTGRPVNSAMLASKEAFVFHYPYVTTPCFLINIGRSLSSGQQLETADEGSYQWQGGSGPDQSVVGFSAICAHKLTYPTRTVSFLSYRPGSTQFFTSSNAAEERQQIIFCCSERSAYDPARGAEVIGGPARQPLTAIEIEYDAVTDQYFAMGTRGGELFDSFFEKFRFRLELDHGLSDVRAEVTGQTAVYLHSEYSKQAIVC